MNQLLERAWWMLALRGTAALLFGILAIAWPGITLLVLVALFAAYAFVSGGAALIAGFQQRKTDKGWWMVLLLGVIGVGAGIVSVFNPAITALVLVLVMGANALFTGVLDIALAIRLRKTIQNEWLLILAGVISVIFGVLVIVFPGAGALAMVWMVSFYAMLTGVLLLALAFRLRAESKSHPQSPKDRGGRPAVAA
jgi:uncharacterized membrane protein HdeD (DUF308 family)